MAGSQGARARRVAGRVQQVVAQALQSGQVKDPRLGFVTVTDARVTGDLREATVFWTVLGDEAEVVATEVALERATGMLRREVGAGLGVKHTPSLRFERDPVPDRAGGLDAALARAREADAELAARREGAVPVVDGDEVYGRGRRDGAGDEGVEDVDR